MGHAFFERPILNSPYAHPARHWELDADGQPTNRIVETRRKCDLVSPVPKPKKRRGVTREQQDLIYGNDGISTRRDQYDVTGSVNAIRAEVELWRKLPNSNQWLVSPETARLLEHWRHHQFQNLRPFFCQIEAVETAIWLTEVAPKMKEHGAKYWDLLRRVNADANPELLRMAFKLATGAGKTTVMTMIIAWQTVNAVRHPDSKRFTRGF